MMIRFFSKTTSVRNRWFSVLFILVVCVICSAVVRAQETILANQSTPVPMIQSGALFSVEFREQCGSPLLQSTLGSKVLVTLRKAGLVVKLGGTPPLFSQENLKYSLVATQGDTDLRTGRIFAEVGPGSELNFKNTEGKAVVLQIDVTEVCWDLDLGAISKKAKEVGADHAFVVRFGVQDLTDEVNSAGSIGKQKSFRVTVEFYVVNISSGNVVDAYSGEKRTMDVSSEGAISTSAEYLATQIVKGLENSRNNGIIGW